MSRAPWIMSFLAVSRLMRGGTSLLKKQIFWARMKK